MGESFVIAVDFGTAYSGYTFNTSTREKENDPILKRWGAGEGLDTPKTPTCILFNEKGEFLKFGYEAKKAYIKMRGEEANRHYFFEGFKMDLYNKDFNKDLKIKAANGEEMEALKVFSESLKFLKDDALKTINANNAGLPFPASNFTWVLMVPAICDESAKQFMREAAIQAGIITEGDDKKLVITLELEAASVWCKKLPADGFISEKHNTKSLDQTPENHNTKSLAQTPENHNTKSLAQTPENHNTKPLDQTPGTQYLIVDCGGGTIDITVHKVLKGGALKELHKASGNNLGGQNVDRKFKEFLREIFTDGVWDEYEQKYPNAIQRIMYEFTRLKQVDEDVKIPCPDSLGQLAEQKKDIERFFESVQGASWDEGYIIISREKLKTFFDDILQGITMSLREILNKNLKIDFILTVGGLAESQIVRELINEEFSEEYKILCPARPQEAILRGAVLYPCGEHVERFDESKHKQQK
ncbi:heat shock 70 kDa protein 12A-like isoform X2 [Poecilia formosa]|uniref:heat shock 70 kDa protein 12A-like isoform X2 n=1 Tax=Poecilia formosa TaxID=48698 RepID=UPI000444217E|nr:PREDICTED: heat shock 70 kDa protein 12A-like isoform X2 [Poecilia formosa]